MKKWCGWLVKLVSIVGLTPILCYSFSNHTTQSADVIPVINEGKIDIATVVFNFQTKDLGTLTDSPTKSDILFYLTYYITDSTYNDVMNELNISTPTIQDQIYTITASVKPSSRTYTGAVNLTYQLKAKVDIATIFTENLKQSLNQSDLLDFAQNTINNYFLNLVYSQYTTDNISVNWNQIQIRDVDYTSSEAKHNQAGSILIEPVNDSNAYTGSATITFPEIFSTLQISNFAYTATTQTFTAPKTGNYILEAWGAAGCNYSGYYGSGGYVSGTINLNAGQTLYVYVGARTNVAYTDTVKANFNGGGACTGSTAGNSKSGGGATDFRLKLNDDEQYPNKWDDPLSLNSRIIVAGGGGGSGDVGASGLQYGHAGGLKGWDSLPGRSHGGTQISGGASTYTNIAPGQFGRGGAVNAGNYSAGGGGGYYGGSAGGYAYGEGSGGSSFISGMNGCVAIANPLTDESEPRTPKSEGDTSVLSYPDVDSKLRDWIFYSTVMIDGGSAMILQNGSESTTGNRNAAGYARISYMS